MDNYNKIIIDNKEYGLNELNKEVNNLFARISQIEKEMNKISKEFSLKENNDYLRLTYSKCFNKKYKDRKATYTGIIDKIEKSDDNFYGIYKPYIIYFKMQDLVIVKLYIKTTLYKKLNLKENDLVMVTSKIKGIDAVDTYLPFIHLSDRNTTIEKCKIVEK